MDSRRSNDQHPHFIMHLKFLILFVFAAFVAAQNTDAQKLISDLQGLNNAGNDLQTAVENADPNNVGDDLVRNQLHLTPL